jgi:hypothetical protein
MFLSIFKMMLNAERCSVLPYSTVRCLNLLLVCFLDPDPGRKKEMCNLLGC